MVRPKNVFIDWYKTLSDSIFWEHLKGTKDFELISKALFEDSNKIINPWMRGKFTAEEVSKLVSGKTKIDYKYIFDNLEKSAKTMIFGTTLIPKLINALTAKGVKVYIATDNMDTFTRWTVPAMRINKFFTGFYSSDKIGFLKKDMDDHGRSKFFNKIIEHKSFDFTNSLFLDDNLKIADITTKLGMTFIGIKSTKHTEEVLKEILIQ
jgi:FMN phosphatase YigB (HAD superfamily)